MNMILDGLKGGESARRHFPKKYVDQVILLSKFNRICQTCDNSCKYVAQYFVWDFFWYKDKKYCSSFESKK